MSDQGEIEQLERQIAEDEARLLELAEIERRLLADITHQGFQIATSEKNLEGERDMLNGRLFRNRHRLHDVKR